MQEVSEKNHDTIDLGNLGHIRIENRTISDN